MSDAVKAIEASNCIPHREAIRALLKELERANRGLNKINDVRNSIIGLQTINWSEHIYPLVAALNEAGMQGMDYGEAKPFHETMLKRAVNAEKRAERLVTAAQVVLDAGFCTNECPRDCKHEVAQKDLAKAMEESLA